jgi:outer membrane protein TolC
MLFSSLKLKLFILIVMAAMFLPIPSEGASLPLDIKEALELMLQDNYTLQSLRQEATKAGAFKMKADGTMTPEIGLNAYVDVQKENQSSGGSSRYDNRVARLTLAQSLYSGGRNQALRRQSSQVISMADLEIIDAENRATGELFARFYNVLLQERRLDTENSAISTSEMHLREITRMSELGLANRLEVIRASQQLAANKADLSTAEGLYDSAVISLMNYLSIPPEERRPVTGTLKVLSLSGDREKSLALALENRADLGVLENRIKYQNNQIDIARSGNKPRVTFGASAGFLDPYRGGSSGDDTWRAELALTVPILDRNQARGDVLEAQAVAVQGKIALEQKKLDIKSGVETAWSELESALNRLESTTQALELAEETLRLAEVGFQEGVTPQLDLLSAQTSLTESRLEHLRSLYNQMVALVALRVTEGDIIDWVQEMEF